MITKMRSDAMSLQQAAREYGVDSRTVLRWAGSSLRKLPTGRYAAKSHDRLLRVLVVPTPEGPREIGVRDSRQASRLAKYWDSVQRHTRGDSSHLGQFEGERIKDASGGEVPLLTDVSQLDRLGYAGVLSFESLYARA